MEIDKWQDLPYSFPPIYRLLCYDNGEHDHLFSGDIQS